MTMTTDFSLCTFEHAATDSNYTFVAKDDNSSHPEKISLGLVKLIFPLKTYLGKQTMTVEVQGDTYNLICDMQDAILKASGVKKFDNNLCVKNEWNGWTSQRLRVHVYKNLDPASLRCIEQLKFRDIVSITVSFAVTRHEGHAYIRAVLESACKPE